MVEKVVTALSSQYDEMKTIFSKNEAWWLFRTAAFLETFGWGLLITGILYKKYQLPAYEFILPIAGSIHGVFFISYLLITFFTHRSLNWNMKRLIVAELLANVPLGALVFEQWVKHADRTLRG